MSELKIPANDEIERSTLGVMLMNPDSCELGLSLLTGDDFFGQRNHTVFLALAEIRERGQVREADTPAVAQHLIQSGQLENAGGGSYISSLIDGIPRAANLQYYIDRLRKLTQLRKLQSVCYNAAVNCQPSSEIEEICEPLIAACFHHSGQIGKTYEDVSTLASEYATELDNISRREYFGIMTGLALLDECLAGLRPSESSVVAGEPSMGKSAFSLQVADQAMFAGDPVLLFSEEMSRTSLMARMIARQTRIAYWRLRKPRFLSREDWIEIAVFNASLTDKKLFINDATTSLPSIVSTSALLSRLHGIKLIIIDYAQIVPVPSERDIRLRVSAVSASCQQLAKRLKCHVMLLSQLARNQEHPRPALYRLKESGALEENADIVIAVHRPYRQTLKKEDLGLDEIFVLKHKDGEIGRFAVRFNPDRLRFEEREINQNNA